MKLHVNGSRDSAHLPKRVLEDSAAGSANLAPCVDAASGQRETRRGFEKASHIPIAGTQYRCSMGNSKRKRLLLDDTIALRAIDVFPEYSLYEPRAPRKPNRSAGCLLRLADFHLRPAEVHPDR